MTLPLVLEKVWLDKNKYDEAECQYFEKIAKMDGVFAAMSTDPTKELLERIDKLNRSNGDIWTAVNNLLEKVASVESRLRELETSKRAPTALTQSAPTPVTKTAVQPVNDTENVDDVDLFGSDSEGESEEAKKVKEARLAMYAAKKSKKPALVAKSNIILDIKPWDDETDMKLMEAAVRNVKCDGLLWGASKLVPLAYGIHKLQISCVVEDDKVSVDWLQETIEENEEYVQSVDIAAFNKV